jgi:hypothetical protein
LLLAAGIIFSAAFWMLALKWWADGIYNGTDAIVIAVVVSSLVVGLTGAHTLWQFLLAGIPLALAVAYIIYTYHLGSLKTIRNTHRDALVQAIENDPRNTAARERLAEILHDAGDLDMAVEEMRVVVSMSSEIQPRSTLAKWEKELYLRDTPNPVCRWCDSENQPGARSCARCGAELPLDSRTGRWLVGGKTAKSRYLLLIVAVVGLAGLSLMISPSKVLIPIGLGIIAIIGWSLLRSVTRP